MKPVKKFSVIVTTVTKLIGQVSKILKLCSLVSYSTAIMILYAFNTCFKILSAPAVKRLLTIHIARLPSSSVFMKGFDFQAVSVVQVGLSLWASQQEMLLHSWGCQPYEQNQNSRTRDFSFIVTIPFGMIQRVGDRYSLSLLPCRG